MSFRDNLQHLRDLQDMSQADLAQRIGVSRQSVAKWERREELPRDGQAHQDLRPVRLLPRRSCARRPCRARSGLRGAVFRRREGGMRRGRRGRSGGCVGLRRAHAPARVGRCGRCRRGDPRVSERASTSPTMGPNVNPAPFIIFFSMGVALALLSGETHVGRVSGVSQGAPADRRLLHARAEGRVAQRERRCHRRRRCACGCGPEHARSVRMVPEQYTFAALAMFGCLALAAAIVVYAVMMDRRTDAARYNRLSAGTTVAEPDAAKAPTAGDTLAS